MSDGFVRPMRADEIRAVRMMMRHLWPDAGDYDFSDEVVFVWERQEQGLGGFISLSVRPWAEGCVSEPVPYIEGWWVASYLRGSGVGRALMRAAEKWCAENGYRELGSDADISNVASQSAHAAIGFQPTLRLQFFRKDLTGEKR